MSTSQTSLLLLDCDDDCGDDEEHEVAGFRLSRRCWSSTYKLENEMRCGVLARGAVVVPVVVVGVLVTWDCATVSP